MAELGRALHERQMGRSASCGLLAPPTASSFALCTPATISDPTQSPAVTHSPGFASLARYVFGTEAHGQRRHAGR